MRYCPKCKELREDLVCPVDGTPTTMAVRDPLLGAEVGRFRLVERLGSGAFGVVYRATHRETGGEVAVKLLKAELTTDPAALRRFEAEARHTHRLHHSNTVRLVDFGATTDGRVYLVTEFVHGRSLREAMADERPFTAERTLRIARQIAKSLGEAHSLGIVHRDLKPDNVMLVDQFGEPDSVKVLDFGIAHSLESSGNSTQGPIGTPRYMAPEQWLGMPLAAPSDFYALGILMYEMLSGASPFDVAEDTGADRALVWMNAHVNEAPAPLATRVPPGAVPGWLCAAVDGLLSKSPRDRPADAATLLDSLAGEGRRSAAPVPLAKRRRESHEGLEDTWTGRAAPPGTGRTRRALAAWAGLGLAAAAGAWVAWPERPSAPEATSAEASAAPVEPARPAEPPAPSEQKSAAVGGVAIEGVAVGGVAVGGVAVVSPPVQSQSAQLPRSPEAAVAAPRRGLERPQGVPGEVSAARATTGLAYLHTEPSGATVRVHELGITLDGTTPLRVELPAAVVERLTRGEPVTFEFAMPGRRTIRRAARPEDWAGDTWDIGAVLPGRPRESSGEVRRELPALRLPGGAPR